MIINTMMGIAMSDRMTIISPIPMLPIKPKGMAQSLLNAEIIRCSLFFLPAPFGRLLIKKKREDHRLSLC